MAVPTVVQRAPASRSWWARRRTPASVPRMCPLRTRGLPPAAGSSWRRARNDSAEPLPGADRNRSALAAGGQMEAPVFQRRGQPRTWPAAHLPRGVVRFVFARRAFSAAERARPADAGGRHRSGTCKSRRCAMFRNGERVCSSAARAGKFERAQSRCGSGECGGSAQFGAFRVFHGALADRGRDRRGSGLHPDREALRANPDRRRRDAERAHAARRQRGSG